jgi:fructose-bisphosphate aldolase class II
MLSPAWLEGGGIEMLAGLGRPLAERARVPVAFLLNEARSYEQVLRGMRAGFNAVMLDTSALPWEEALEQVGRLVQDAHARGVAVEAELGHLPDAVDGAIPESGAELTDPDQAAAFVEMTRMDCLAVSVGNVHLLTEGLAPVNLAHLEAIGRRVRVPLVMHGGSSFPPQAVPRAIAGGVAKFNVGSVLKKVFFESVRETVSRMPAGVNVHDVMGSHKEADLMSVGKARMRSKVRELIRLYGGSGRFCVAVDPI